MNASPNPHDPTALDRETLVVCGVVMLGGVMSILDMTVVNVALDALATDFNASLTTIQWVITAYTLALAAVIPITGWASDRFGSKRIFICATAAFTLGSVLCALAWSPGSLIAFRVIQGLGGGMVLPVVTTIVTKKAGPQRRGRVMGILGVPFLAAPILGPIVGGWLVDSISWRAVFFVNLPVGIVTILLAQIVLERDRPQPAHRLDWLGMVLLSPGLALLIFGFAESPAHGFAATRTWLPIAAGATLIAAFFVHSWRDGDPLIDVKTFVHTRAGAAAATLLLLATSLFGTLLLIPVYFQVVRGTSALESGLLLIPQGFGAMAMMPLAGWLTDRFGPYRLPVFAVPLLIAGTAPFALVTDTTSFTLLCGFNLVLGLGMGLGFMPTMTSAVQAVPERAIARTSTAMSVIDQSGASIGAAILSVLLAGAIAAAIPGAAGGLDALGHLSGARRAAFSGELSEAFATTFLWALGVLVLTMIPALMLARGKGPQRASRLATEPESA
ncbi:MAG TPA: DHA2 family efflux MFS transporter permease subunit [Solirubrobacterales bacterium]|nr:DHA2 family efflux MFS transporter permease subunit [Solirubrobacterales bacterium]